MTMILTRTASAVMAAMLCATAAPAQEPPALIVPLPAEDVDHTVEVIATFPPGTFLEGVAFAPDGGLLVSNGTAGEIVRVGMDGAVEVVATLPLALGGLGAEIAGTLVIGADGAIFATAIVPSATGSNNGVWRIAPDTAPVLFARLPDGAIANGIAMGPSGDLYTADSIGGRVFRIDRKTGTATVWAEDARLAARLGSPIPGVNGIAYRKGAFTVSVPDRGTILRIAITGNGSAGAIETIGEGAPGDGIALDVRGDVYVTTHPFDTVVRIDATGRRETVATAEDGVVGPTDAAFGTAPGDQSNLYVVTDGGLFAALLNPSITLQEARVSRISVGRDGAPSGWRIAD